MTLKPVVGGTSRAQALGLSLRYATTRTSEATLTGQPGNTYTLSVTVPLSEVKPPQLNARITKALQNGFVPSLTMPGSAKHLPAESVKVKVTGNPPELHVDATFQGQPGDLSGRLKETQALDLSFTHPRGLPEFRVDLQLSELAVDRTPLERSLAEKGVGESKADLGAWKTEFEAAKAKAPSEAAALERARADAAQAMAEAESAVARARTAIDARSAQVPADRLATVLRGLDVPAGQAWRTPTSRSALPARTWRRPRSSSRVALKSQRRASTPTKRDRSPTWLPRAPGSPRVKRSLRRPNATFVRRSRSTPTPRRTWRSRTRRATRAIARGQTPWLRACSGSTQPRFGRTRWRGAARTTRTPPTPS